MEGHEGIPSASIILCLTVTSTFMLLYLIGIIKDPSNEDPALENFPKSNGPFSKPCTDGKFYKQFTNQSSISVSYMNVKSYSTAHPQIWDNYTTHFAI